MPSAACCPCGQLVGCVCNGVACGTICERKAATAELCGFDEFLPSSPPKYYKRRRTTGTMNITGYSTPGCGGVIVAPAGTECRSKSGTATLIGMQEYSFTGSVGPPSVPARRYRKKTTSGRLFSCGFGGSLSTCHGNGVLNRRTEYETSGVVQYDKNTGASINNMVYNQYRSPDNPGVSCSVAAGLVTLFQTLGLSQEWPEDGSVPIEFPEGSVACRRQQPSAPVPWSASKTHATWGLAGDCTSCTNTTTNQTRGAMTGQINTVMEDEDTPNDAIARNLPTIGAWTNGACNVSTSYQVPRTGTSISVNYRFGQTRLVATGLINGEDYEGKIKVLKRLYGTADPFVDAGTDIIVSFTAAGGAFTSDWKDLPSDAAYEYMAGAATVAHGGLDDATVDSWDVDESFVPNLPAVCAPTVVADNSARTVNGAPVAWPYGGTLPGAAYGGLAVGTIAPTERQTIGTGVCTLDGATYKIANGAVAESLSEEDTEEDAIERATAAAAWVACAAGCAVGCTAFMTQRGTGAVFGFALVRTKVTWAATIGASYLVTVRFASRVLGTGGPFLFYALAETVVTADAVSESTDWIDVPSEPGLEVMVANCTVEALP